MRSRCACHPLVKDVLGLINLLEVIGRAASIRVETSVTTRYATGLHSDPLAELASTFTPSPDVLRLT
jgi:hypothetical protein